MRNSSSIVLRSMLYVFAGEGELSVCCTQFVCVLAVGDDPDILVPGLILADNAVQLRVTDGNAHTAVRLGRLIKIHVQNRADDIIA